MQRFRFFVILAVLSATMPISAHVYAQSIPPESCFEISLLMMDESEAKQRSMIVMQEVVIGIGSLAILQTQAEGDKSAVKATTQLHESMSHMLRAEATKMKIYGILQNLCRPTIKG